MGVMGMFWHHQAFYLCGHQMFVFDRQSAQIVHYLLCFFLDIITWYSDTYISNRSSLTSNQLLVDNNWIASIIFVSIYRPFLFIGLKLDIDFLFFLIHFYFYIFHFLYNLEMKTLLLSYFINLEFYISNLL